MYIGMVCVCVCVSFGWYINVFSVNTVLCGVSVCIRVNIHRHVLGSFQCVDVCLGYIRVSLVFRGI